MSRYFLRKCLLLELLARFTFLLVLVLMFEREHIPRGRALFEAMSTLFSKWTLRAHEDERMVYTLSQPIAQLCISN